MLLGQNTNPELKDSPFTMCNDKETQQILSFQAGINFFGLKN